LYLPIPPPPTSTLFPYTTLFRSRSSRKGAVSPAKKNRNRVIPLIDHGEILFPVAIEISGGNCRGVEPDGNRDGFLERAVAVAEEHIHCIRERITGEQVVASAAGERR